MPPKTQRPKQKRQYTKRKAKRTKALVGVAAARSVHSFSRTVKLADLGIGSNTYEFKLSQLQNVTDFSNLFDQYRIRNVKLMFVPRVSSTENIVSAACATMVIMNDFDGSFPATESALMETGMHKMYRLLDKITWTCSPRVLNEIYKDGVTTAYGLRPRGEWIDMGNTTVSHFGTAAFVNGPATSYDTNVYLTINFECKNTR